MTPEEIVEKLEGLLSFGYSEAQKINVNIYKQTTKTLLTFSLMGAIQSYSYAILDLAKAKRYKQAEVILRSIIETHINLRFILVDPLQKNSKKFQIKAIYENREFLTKINGFLSSNPRVNAGLFSEFNLDQEINRLTNVIDKNIRKFPYLATRMADLRQRAVACDNNDETKKMEWLYLSVYPHLSGCVHITANGLGGFFQQNQEDGNIFHLDGNDEDGKRVLLSTYATYLDSIYLYFKYFRIYKLLKLHPYRKILKEENERASTDS